MSVSAALVMKLRKRTGAGIMECKRFLIAADGDIELAIVEMRKAGQAKADKKSNRIAAEGLVQIACNRHIGILGEFNVETDFSAQNVAFVEFTKYVVDSALKNNASDIQQLLSIDPEIEHMRQQLIIKIGENVQLRRMVNMTNDTGVIGAYLHGGRIGVLVSLIGDNEKLAKDIAMHIAASRPLVINRDQVSAEIIAKEREIYTAQARESGKPADVMEKMIDGCLNKFLDGISLLDQVYVKNTSLKIHQLLLENQATIVEFVCFEVGEGITKKIDNFVDEVMSQVREQL